MLRAAAHARLPLFVALLALMTIGLAVLYSAGNESPRLVMAQGVRFVLGFVAMWALSRDAAHAAAQLDADGVRGVAAAAARGAGDRHGQARATSGSTWRVLFPAGGTAQAEPADDGGVVPATARPLPPRFSVGAGRRGDADRACRRC